MNESGIERKLLVEVAEIATRLRRLRATPATVDRAQVAALEQQSRAKWNEIRALRAGPAPAGAEELTSRSLYR